jgi:uncharacterized membrane protein
LVPHLLAHQSIFGSACVNATDSDLRRVVRILSSLVACLFRRAAADDWNLGRAHLFPLQSLREQYWLEVACALAARHIGGAISLCGVAETLKIPTVLYRRIAADNVVVAYTLDFSLVFPRLDLELVAVAGRFFESGDPSN